MGNESAKCVIKGVCGVRTRNESGATKDVHFYSCGPYPLLTEAMQWPLMIEVSWPNR
jgi:hypothetical protein